VIGACGQRQKSGSRSKVGPAASSKATRSLLGPSAHAERSWPGVLWARSNQRWAGTVAVG
jgi:hypothetical protein